METFVKKNISQYQGIKVTERDIIAIVGMDIYRALYYLYPDLYQSEYYNASSPPFQEIYKVQSLASRYGLSGEQIKQLLVNAVIIKNPNTLVSELISPQENIEYPTDFISEAFIILCMCLLSICLIIVAITIFQHYYPQLNVLQNQSLYPKNS